MKETKFARSEESSPGARPSLSPRTHSRTEERCSGSGGLSQHCSAGQDLARLSPLLQSRGAHPPTHGTMSSRPGNLVPPLPYYQISRPMGTPKPCALDPAPDFSSQGRVGIAPGPQNPFPEPGRHKGVVLGPPGPNPGMGRWLKGVMLGSQGSIPVCRARKG